MFIHDLVAATQDSYLNCFPQEDVLRCKKVDFSLHSNFATNLNLFAT
jgi:hypothetical protein